MPNPYLDYVIDPTFKGVNRLVLSFENSSDRSVNPKYLVAVEIKCSNRWTKLFFSSQLKMI